MVRIHRALSEAEIESRVLYGYGDGWSTDAEVHIQPRNESFVSRLLRRCGIKTTACGRTEKRIQKLCDGRQEMPESFSHPYSPFDVEQQLWIKNADVIHLHWVSGFLNYPHFFNKVDKPIVWTLHDQNPYLGGFHYEWERDRFPELQELEEEFLAVKKTALKGRAIHVVGNSRWNTERARQSGFFPKDSTFQTVYYPLNPDEFYPIPKNVARQALGMPTEARVLGFACHDLNTKRKGLDFLIDLLPGLKKQSGDKLMLLSFGQEPAVDVRKGLDIPWMHLGYLTEPVFQRLAYSAMDYFLVPSRAEAFGQTAIEAIACGTRVVASNVDGLTEALNRGSWGRLCTSDANEEWMSVLTAELGSTSESKALAKILDRHQPNEIAGDYLHVYERALG